MYILLDENDNITDLVLVGGIPEQKFIELDIMDLPSDVYQNPSHYKYIDDQFIERDQIDINNDILQKLIPIKIDNMKQICSTQIVKGIDYNDEHYSLTGEDQINLLKITQMAELTPSETPLFYHADGKLCRQYSHEEISMIGLIGTTWITYHTTYFNFLKHQLSNDMTDIDEIINFNYGDPLYPQYQQQIDAIIGEQQLFPIDIIPDEMDYSFLYNITSEAMMENFTNGTSQYTDEPDVIITKPYVEEPYIDDPDNIDNDNLNGDDSNGNNETSETEETIETTETNQEPTIEETEEGIDNEEDIDISD